jgi:hypothetical protein
MTTPLRTSSGRRVLAEIDRHSAVVVIEDGDELQPSSEGLEVVPECRDPGVVSMFELGDRPLGWVTSSRPAISAWLSAS